MKNIDQLPSVSKSAERIEGLFAFMTKSPTDLYFHMTVPGGEYKYVSPSVRNLSGLDPEEFYRNPFLIQEIIHPDWRDYLRETWDELCRGIVRPSYVFQMIDQYGRVRWCSQRVSLQKDEQGNPCSIDGVVTDITEFKELEEKLRLSRMEIEARILKRTNELDRLNRDLRKEVQTRQEAEQRIQALTQQLLSIQEEERRRLALDLHDRVAQDISTANLILSDITDGDDTWAAFAKVGKAQRLLRESIASIRSISYGLRPSALDELGLEKAVRDFTDKFNRAYYPDVDLICAGTETLRIDPEAEINIFRIIQDALDNVLKHAEASKVSIWLVRSHPDLILRIEDNGCGFDLEKVEADHRRRVGLNRMRERARLIGGEFSIQSRPGSGTRITVTLTIERKGG